VKPLSKEVWPVLTTDRFRRALPGAVAVAVLTAVIGLLLLVLGVRVDLVMKAAGIPKSASGIGGFVNGAHALVTPALVMVAAVAPIGLIAGGVVMMFGGRRGMQMVATSLGVLLLLGSVTALID
jgi:hypothetical protein